MNQGPDERAGDGAAAAGETAIEKDQFGSLPDGSRVDLYRLRTSRLELDVTTFGGRIVDLRMLNLPRHPGTSVVLGFKSLDSYLTDRSYMGALIGRFANRIAGGRFRLGGSAYQVSLNNGANSLHGGKRGFDQRLWSARVVPGGLTLSYTSEAGEEGYPGELQVDVTYTLKDNQLLLSYAARTTADTPINLTNHLYFNLSGQPRSEILDHIVLLHADQFTPVDPSLIPTGELRDVAGTPFDFRSPQAIGARIDEEDIQLAIGQGYDHNWVLRHQGEGLSRAAAVTHPTSGRRLEVLTSEPGVQFYTGNQLRGEDASAHGRRCGFCLETQHFPDSPNHANFPEAIVRAGNVFRSETIYRFSGQ